MVLEAAFPHCPVVAMSAREGGIHSAFVFHVLGQVPLVFVAFDALVALKLENGPHLPYYKTNKNKKWKIELILILSIVKSNIPNP